MSTDLTAELTKYAHETAADNSVDFAAAVRMMGDEPAEVALAIGCTEGAVRDWVSEAVSVAPAEIVTCNAGFALDYESPCAHPARSVQRTILVSHTADHPGMWTQRITGTQEVWRCRCGRGYQAADLVRVERDTSREPARPLGWLVP